MPGQAASMPRARAATETADLLDFDEVYREHVRFVWRVMRYMGVPAEATDDATQDAFLVVHRRLAEFGGGSVRAWLWAIARGVARNHRRAAIRAERRRELAPLPAMPSAPDQVVAERERMQWIERLLASLDPDKRDVFVLIEIEGLSAPEVGQMLGVPTNTIYSRLRRARELFGDAVAGSPGTHAGGPR